MDEPTRKPAILAGDEEREHSTQALSQAVVEGRLTLEEFSDRVGAAQAARTREELATLTQDLPAAAAPAPSSDLAPPPSSNLAAPRATELAPAPERHLAFCSQLVRSGPWELAARSSFRSIFGIHPPSTRPVSGAPKLRIAARGPGGTLYVRSRSSSSQ
ncbi:MAG: DUF1707 domain-containing protein [Solirubrobacteraceae bacterium]